MLRAVRLLLSLGSADRLLLIRAFLALALVDLRLRLLGFQRLVDSLSTSGTARAPTEQELRRARRYARWLGAAGRHHFLRARCLHQSLALQGWLLSEGLPAELRIGVRTVHRSLLAHAWVELGGHLVNDRPDTVSAFTPLASPRAAPSARDQLATDGPARHATSAAAVGGAQWS